MIDLPRLHLVNRVTGWTGDDGQLVMVWRVVDDSGKALSGWKSSRKAAIDHRERLWACKPDGRASKSLCKGEIA